MDNWQKGGALLSAALFGIVVGESLLPRTAERAWKRFDARLDSIDDALVKRMGLYEQKKERN